MLELKRLLKFTPEEAILMMANKTLNTYLRPEIAVIDHIEAIDGKRTKAYITVLDVKPDMIQNPYAGGIVLEYNRYDIGEILGQILIDIPPPTTIRNVIDIVSKQTGIIFTDDDFVNGRIDESTFILEAAETSKRWVGTLSVILNVSTSKPHISQWLPYKDHDGLVIKPKIYFWDKFPNDILDGFVLGKPDIGFYIRTVDHEGLIQSTKPDISVYLTNVDHEGLILPLSPSAFTLPEGYTL